MARYAAVAFLGCLYLAGSIWLVQREGRAYRQSIHRADTSRGVSGSTPSVTGGPTTPATGPLTESPAPWELIKPGQPLALNRSEDEIDPTSPDPEPSAPQDSEPPRPGSLVANGESHRVPDPYWSQPFLNKVWDLDTLTAQDEAAIGGELNRVILEFNPRDDRTSTRGLLEVVTAYTESRPRMELNYSVTILDSDVPNAFSHPGGYLYVSRGLLDMVADAEDHVLEFVIGHELAHLELGHAMGCLRSPVVRELKDGTLRKLYFLILPHAYPDELEFAADEWVYSRMRRRGRSNFEILACLRKVAAYAKANGFENGRAKPEDTLTDPVGDEKGIALASPIENHLRAHTAAWKRLDHLKRLRDQAAKPSDPR